MASPKSILLIEDNKADIDLLELALENAGVHYKLEIFQRGGEALEFVREHAADGKFMPPDLVILDLNLPQHDGVEILEAMRKSTAFATVPVAVFSSSSLPREQAKLEALRIRHYIRKPTDLDELFGVGTVIKNLLAEV